MNIQPPSVRLLIAALLGVFFMPAATSAGVVNPTQATSSEQTTSGQTLKVSMTAYNAVPDQTDANPLVTASGAYSDPNIVAARSSDLSSELPYGTVIEIDSATSSPSCGYSSVGDLIGYRVIADAMNAKWRDKIDILLPQSETTVSGKTVNPARVLGVCSNVTIKVVGHVNMSDMPKTQAELVSALDSSAELAVAK